MIVEEFSLYVGAHKGRTGEPVPAAVAVVPNSADPAIAGTKTT